MDIDLELPSVQKDKGDTAADTYTTDGSCRRLAEEEDVNFPTTGANCLENPVANVENIIMGGDRVDLTSVGVDVVNKGVINYEPRKGLEFETKEAAYCFYREYAMSVGFGITIKASRRSKKSGKFIDVKIACSRFGSKRESSTTVNPRSCPKTDCKASMHMKRRQDGKWYIYSFIKEHNHEICGDDFYYATRGRNKQSGIVACQKKGLQLALDEEDVKVLLENFMLMQAENPSFFYGTDLDQEKRMRNVFWIDAKGRHDYVNFCDVVLFDTSYVRDKFKIPFVPIVGVNHHFQFMLFGGALIGDEMKSTFVWLMRTWLRAVGGKTPQVVITDDDRSLKEATTEVFSDARHCFCLWHVLRKIPENLSHVGNRFENFMKKFNKCIYRSWTEEEFENRWWKMIDRFELREDEWIQSLYDDRKKWAPTYMRDTSLAGLCTNERSESIPSFFDKYIHKETAMKEFIDQYKVFLHNRDEEEGKADYETWHKQPMLRSLSPSEKQMSKIYTHHIFKKFQVEVLGTVSCSLQKDCDDETTLTYRVNDFEQRQYFIVARNEADSVVCCLCRSFEYRGFLCRHAMVVLQISGVSNIPSNYILKRWTKDAKIRQNMSGISNRLQYRGHRFNDLCRLAIKLGEEGSLSQETYDMAFYALEEALKQCIGVNNFVRSVSESNMWTSQGFLNIEEDYQGLNMAKASKKRKLPKKRKAQYEAEVTSIGMEDSSQQIGQLNPRAHALDNSYVSRQELQGMEIGFRTPIFDGYYGARRSVQGDRYYSDQQDMQGLGNLNSIPTRVDHYGPQQSLQGLLQGHLSFRVPTMHGCFDIEESLHDMNKHPSQ